MLLLVRHGESTYNAEDRLQGQANPPLSDAGRAQAQATAPLIARLQPVRAICSDLDRARETAAILGFPAATPDPRWREIGMGDWQDRLAPEVRAEAPEHYDQWRDGDRAAPNGETFDQLNDRVKQAAEEALALPGITLVVTHGGAVRAALTALLGIPRRNQAGLGNASLTMLAPGPKLVAYNVGPDGPSHVQPGV